MNDLDLLKSHGPAATPASADVLDRARVALQTEIARAPQSDAPVVPLLPRPARVKRRRVLALGLAAATVAGVAVATPALVGSDRSGAIALAPVDLLSFPLTPAEVPVGLGDPVFDLDPTFWMAQYRGAGADRLTVVLPDSEEHWSIPDDAEPVAVSGQDGVLFEDGDGTVRLVWTQADGDLVGVSGTGSFADADRVEAFAESLTERPQPVDLALTVAPEGWEPTAYKEDRIVRYAGGDGAELSLVVVDEVSPGLAGYGATEVSQVEVSGQPAMLGRVEVDNGGQGWVLEARTADGTPYSLQAPPSFTKEQVLEVAEGVRHRG